MIGRHAPGGEDPRRALTSAELQAASDRARPMVARKGGSDALGLGAGLFGACLLGAFTLVSLSQGRAQASGAAPPAPRPPAAARAARANPPPQPTPVSAPTPAPAVMPAASVAAQPDQSRTGAMIFDNSAPPAPTGATPAAAQAAAAGLSADEQFAVRTGGEGVPVARASALARPDWTVVQGAVIPAVLETALNSDTSGYARAIVSRDVRSFDGSRVLVPRGSRLIGQYRSGLSAGQSRAFVIWNRLVRPDGTSIQLGSPAIDAEGAGGLAGQVDRHYAQRYGAAVLLSLVSGLASSLGGSGDTVVVGAGGAQSAAAEALRAEAAIPPTVRVPLGTPIQVFVARDLDFSPQ